MQRNANRLGEAPNRTPGPGISSGAQRERLRRRYRPRRVRVLLVGEAPPASGRFFYRADSGLYRAIRRPFVALFPSRPGRSFLESFRDHGCFLVDLCGRPVDRLPPALRRKARREGEAGLARALRALRPSAVVVVVKSVGASVRRSARRADWSGTLVELPYPGRWKRNRENFDRGFRAVLRRVVASRG